MRCIIIYRKFVAIIWNGTQKRRATSWPTSSGMTWNISELEVIEAERSETSALMARIIELQGLMMNSHRPSRPARLRIDRSRAGRAG